MALDIDSLLESPYNMVTALIGEVGRGSFQQYNAANTFMMLWVGAGCKLMPTSFLFPDGQYRHWLVLMASIKDNHRQMGESNCSLDTGQWHNIIIGPPGPCFDIKTIFPGMGFPF